MKVGILTYHWEDNYGATMQAYATYKAIQTLGHDPEFIDLRLPYNHSIKYKIGASLKRVRFNAFRKKYFKNLTPKTYWSVEELRKNPPKEDCYLVGSDQTWNPQIGAHLLPAFFLTFGDSSVRRVSYATSIGLNEWEESSYISNKEIQNAVSKFHKILLRENTGIDICRDIFKANAAQVIDPVLLFSSYPELVKKENESGELIVYKLKPDPYFYDMAREVANSLEVPIRSIGSMRRPKGYRTSYPEPVEKWISRIANASKVLTDSFHGTVFSLLYHRPFVSYIGNPSRITRIKSLLEQLGLENRILTKTDSIEKYVQTINEPIDWRVIDNKLEKLRADSFRLLNEALMYE